MATIANQLPFKVYEVSNAASTDAHVFIGKSSIAGLNGASEDFFPHLADQSCFTTFLFASIVGGCGVRVEPATETDPYIYIDARWYDFRPSGNDNPDPESWPANSIISSVDFGDAGDMQVNLKNITTDGSLAISVGDSYVWSDQGPEGVNDGGCTIKLEAHKYEVSNCRDTNPSSVSLLLQTNGVPGASDVEFVFKSLAAGNGIEITDEGGVITIGRKIPDCPPCPED